MVATEKQRLEELHKSKQQQQKWVPGERTGRAEDFRHYLSYKHRRAKTQRPDSHRRFGKSFEVLQCFRGRVGDTAPYEHFGQAKHPRQRMDKSNQLEKEPAAQHC